MHNQSKKSSAVLYYLTSITNLLRNSSFWKAPLLLAASSLSFLSDKIKSINLEISVGIVIRVGQEEFFVKNLMDYWTLKEVVIDDVYRIRKTIKSGQTVIDIGASVGDFSIMAYKQGARRVLSYECDPDRISLFEKNLKLHQARTQDQLRHRTPTQSQVLPIELHKSAASSLDQIFEENQLTSCDLLKIDCEGCEYQVLSEAKESISRVSQIAMECHLFNREMRQKYQDMISFLKNSGFELEIESNPVHEDICYLFAQNKY
ncbi:MAG: FkbM family methyltransferase [Candidatus Pacebacteria bacterium]|nr:FkbM family methyltransferase [Candidatus Paceibacterota bacterium]